MEILASGTTLDWMKGSDRTIYYECPYDGFINIAKHNTTGSFNILVETSVDRGQTWQLTTAELSCGGGGITIPVTKGTFVRGGSSQYNLYYDYATAWWYKHPMFIKATSAIEITDQDTFLNTVVQSVAQGQSYSTTEQLTGGTWIDGKPIYRKVLKVTTAFTINSSGWTDVTSKCGSPTMNIDTLIYGCNNVEMGYLYKIDGSENQIYGARPSGSKSIPVDSYFWFEYTKTTD